METDCSPAGPRVMTGGSAQGRDLTGEKERKELKEKSDHSEKEYRVNFIDGDQASKRGWTAGRWGNNDGAKLVKRFFFTASRQLFSLLLFFI